MVPGGDTPKATRRRVRAFVAAALVVLAVVGFWPLKGYRIEALKFADSLGSHFFSASNVFGNPRTVKKDEGPPPVFVDAWNLRSIGEAKRILAFKRDRHAPLPLRIEVPPYDADLFYVGDDPAEVSLLFRIANIYGSIRVNSDHLPAHQSGLTVIRASITAVLDGIDREIPGVTTFYNPPARQLWYDRGKPACEKIEEWIRELFAP